MKNFIQVSILFAILLGLSSSQPKLNDCTFYFPASEGAEFELTNYNKKGKVETINKHKVLEKSESGGVVSFKASYALYEGGKDKLIAEGDYEVKCEDNVFKFDFGAINPMASAQSGMKDMEMEMKADLLGIPANPSPGQDIGGGEITMEMKNGGTNFMTTTATITNRKVEGNESITTPAGTFDCVKISYQTEVKTMMIKIKTKSIDWYAQDVGLVRSEYYNKKGKLTGYSELTKLTK